MLRWLPLIIALPLVLILRIAGLIDNVWMACAIGAVIFIWVMLWQNIPWPRWRFPIATLAIIMMLSSGLWGVSAKYWWEEIRASADISLGLLKKSSQRKGLYEAYQKSYKLERDQEMLPSRNKVLGSLQLLEEQLGDKDGDKLKAIYDALQENRIDAKSAWASVRAIIQNINENRKAEREIKAELESRQAKPVPQKETRSGFWTIGGLLAIGALLIVAGLFTGLRKQLGIVGTILLVIGLCAVFWPETSRQVWQGVAAAQAGRGQVFKRELGCLRPGQKHIWHVDKALPFNYGYRWLESNQPVVWKAHPIGDPIIWFKNRSKQRHLCAWVAWRGDIHHPPMAPLTP